MKCNRQDKVTISISPSKDIDILIGEVSSVSNLLVLLESHMRGNINIILNSYQTHIVNCDGYIFPTLDITVNELDVNDDVNQFSIYMSLLGGRFEEESPKLVARFILYNPITCGAKFTGNAITYDDIELESSVCKNYKSLNYTFKDSYEYILTTLKELKFIPANFNAKQFEQNREPIQVSEFVIGGEVKVCKTLILGHIPVNDEMDDRFKQSVNDDNFQNGGTRYLDFK